MLPQVIKMGLQVNLDVMYHERQVLLSHVAMSTPWAGGALTH